MKDSNGKPVNIGDTLLHMNNLRVEVVGFVDGYLCEVRNTDGEVFFIDECILDCVWEVVDEV